MFSGNRSDSTVPSGSLANASSVGAKTVNGHSLFSVATRSAAVTAATSVLNMPASTATSTMSFADLSAWNENAAVVNTNSANNGARKIFFMSCALLFLKVRSGTALVARCDVAIIPDF